MQILVRWDCQVASMASMATNYIPSENLKKTVQIVTKSCGSYGMLRLDTPLRYANTCKVRLSSGSHGICGDKIYTLRKFEKTVQIVTKSCGSCGMLRLETPLRYANTVKMRLSIGSRGICGDKICTLWKSEKTCSNCHKVLWQLWHAEITDPLEICNCL